MDIYKFIKICQKYFPQLNIKFKNESFLMKIISYILFFNKSFMTDYITTIGNTVYFPSKEGLTTKSKTILLHELVHIFDAKKYSNTLFSLLYLSPQILSIFFIPLLFVSWWFIIPIILLLLPLPAYFRMIFEKRAYMVSLYTAYVYSKKNHLVYDIYYSKEYILRNFKTSAYYFMWTFSDLDKEFDKAIIKILNDQKPFDEDVLFLFIDKIIDEDVNSISA